MTREEALTVLEKYEVNGCGVCLQDDYKNNIDAEDVMKFAIEAVKQLEIIRCKDCKRWNTVVDRSKAEYGLCQIRTQLEATKRDDWCSRAERREDG